MSLIDSLKWRYATKKYDNTKKVSTENIEKIKDAIQLSASSFGLQLYKVLIIENQSIKQSLRSASWNQPQVEDASHLLVFCSYATVTDTNIDDYVKLKSEIQGIELSEISGYGNFIKGGLKNLTENQKQTWMAKQTYIALANALAICGELKIDATPMEGFLPDQYNEILGLAEKGLTASVVMAIGYRSEEDNTQNDLKVRKSKDDLFEVI